MAERYVAATTHRTLIAGVDFDDGCRASGRGLVHRRVELLGRVFVANYDHTVFVALVEHFRGDEGAYPGPDTPVGVHLYPHQ
jgi:hypothetical protein